MFAIYKRGQGRYTRILTTVGVLVVAVVGAYRLSEKLRGYTLTSHTYVRFGVPALIVALLGWLMFWVVNRPKSADFLIATEGEMKKVSWSSRREIIGSTKVVIATAFLMAVILFGVDLLFMAAFRWMGVLGPSGA